MSATDAAASRPLPLGADDAAENELPLLRAERIWGFNKFSGMNVSLAIATWAFLQGGAVALYVGAKEAIVSIVIGYGISAILVSLAPCIPTAKYGIEQYVGLRSVFGTKGARVVMVFMSVLVMAAWTALLAIMGGHALVNVSDEVFGRNLAGSSAAITAAALLGVLVCYLLLIRGPKAVGRVGAFLAPVLIVLTLGMLVLVFTKVSWGELASTPPLYPMEDRHLAFMLAVELNVAGGFAWWPMIGNLARLTDSPRASFWPNAFGLFLASVVAAVVGVFAALALGSDDPTVWMIPLGGAVLGIAALGFVAFANLTSMVAEAYSGISAIRGLNERIRFVRWGVLSAIFLAPVALIVCFPETVYDNYGRFLSWVAIVVAPLCAIQLVDFFLLRGRRMNLRDLYRPTETSRYAFWAGYNPMAFAALAIGALSYALLLHPVTYEPSGAFSLLGASVPAFIVSGAIYWLGTQVLVRRAGRGGYGMEDAPKSGSHKG